MYDVSTFLHTHLFRYMLGCQGRLRLRLTQPLARNRPCLLPPLCGRMSVGCVLVGGVGSSTGGRARACGRGVSAVGVEAHHSGGHSEHRRAAADTGRNGRRSRRRRGRWWRRRRYARGRGRCRRGARAAPTCAAEDEWRTSTDVDHFARQTWVNVSVASLVD